MDQRGSNLESEQAFNSLSNEILNGENLPVGNIVLGDEERKGYDVSSFLSETRKIAQRTISPELAGKLGDALLERSYPGYKSGDIIPEINAVLAENGLPSMEGDIWGFDRLALGLVVAANFRYYADATILVETFVEELKILTDNNPKVAQSFSENLIAYRQERHQKAQEEEKAKVRMQRQKYSKKNKGEQSQREIDTRRFEAKMAAIKAEPDKALDNLKVALYELDKELYVSDVRREIIKASRELLGIEICNQIANVLILDSYRGWKLSKLEDNWEELYNYDDNTPEDMRKEGYKEIREQMSNLKGSYGVERLTIALNTSKHLGNLKEFINSFISAFDEVANGNNELVISFIEKIIDKRPKLYSNETERLGMNDEVRSVINEIRNLETLYPLMSVEDRKAEAESIIEELFQRRPDLRDIIKIDSYGNVTVVRNEG